MFLYINKNKEKSLKITYQKIRSLFPVAIQTEIENFLKEIELFGGCQTESYNKVYEILNRTYDDIELKCKNVKEENDNDNAIDNDDWKKLIEILNVLRFQFATRFFFNKKEKEMDIDKKHNKNLIR